jgi:hypothetical protein
MRIQASAVIRPDSYDSTLLTPGLDHDHELMEGLRATGELSPSNGKSDDAKVRIDPVTVVGGAFGEKFVDRDYIACGGYQYRRHRGSTPYTPEC